MTAELGAKSAWVGEGVPLYITLYSPGPFSGTATFDLPELPHTFIIKQDHPTVGSETTGGETWMTQRHEFRIYTQTGGTIELPAIHVRFNAKKDFVSKPEPREGTTSTLRLESRQPPGTQSKQIVVATPEMKIEQTWSIDPGQTLEAGDVIERRIVRRATKTTGMVLPAPSTKSIDGARIYTSVPVVNDKIERGASLAMRTDIIKYQFTAGGRFQLPKLEFIWWNPKKEELESQHLDGIELAISALPVQTKEKKFSWEWLWILVFIPLMWGLKRLIESIQGQLRQPERIAARAVVSACRKNRPAEAYAAMMQWAKVSNIRKEGCSLEQNLAGEIATEWQILSKALYSPNPKSWQGAALAKTFRAAKRTQGKRLHRPVAPGLPNLNPTWP